MLKKRMIGALMLSLVCANGYAAEVPQYSLDTMVVTATRDQISDLRVPSVVTVLTEKELKATGAKDLMSALNGIDSIYITVSPTSKFINMRGFDKGILLLIDGQPTNVQDGYSLDMVSMSNIDRVEIVRGGASVLYGSEAFGGVINVITKKRSEVDRITHANISAGNSGQRYGELGLKVGKFAVSGEYRRIGDNGPTSTIYYPGTDQAMYYHSKENETKIINAKYQFSDQFDLQYFYSNKQNDVDTVLENSGALKEKTLGDLKYHIAQLNYANKDTKVSFSLRDRNWHNDKKAPSGAYKSKTVYDGRTYGLDMQHKWQLEKGHIIGGATWENESYAFYAPLNSGTYRDFPKSSRNQYGIFGLLQYDADEKNTMYVGARQHYVKGADKKDDAFCPQVEYVHLFNDDESFFANVNRSFRMPKMLEIFGYTASQMPNLDLGPEKGWNYEMGYKKQFEDGVFKVSGYFMDYTDKIASIRLDGKRKNINAAGFRNSGVEASWNSHISDNLGYRLGVNLSNPEQQNKSTDPWAPVNSCVQLTGGLNYNNKELSSSIIFNYFTNRADAESDLLSIDAGIQYKASNCSTFAFGVQNLLDRDDIQNGNTMLVPARLWNLEFRYSF